MHTIDLDSYFSRIGYTGATEATLEVLNALHFAHVTSIPFETLSPWTSRRVYLTLESIEAKLIGARRGGYCFEQNALFSAVLRQLGFQVTDLVARVCWNQPPTGHTHMFLMVEIEGESWIADVGFGAVGQTVPMRLVADEIQSTPHESRRYHFENGVYLHQMQLGPDRWEDLYFFDLKPALAIDYEVANWFTNSHPDSLFRKTLLTTLPQKDHWRVIAFGEFTRRYLDGRVEKRLIVDDEDLRKLLSEEFGIPADDPAVLDAGLAPRPGVHLV